MINSVVNLEKKIEKVDMIITGEGQLDCQTERGNVPFGIADLAKIR